MLKLNPDILKFFKFIQFSNALSIDFISAFLSDIISIEIISDIFLNIFSIEKDSYITNFTSYSPQFLNLYPFSE